jgi:hypothetical protein
MTRVAASRCRAHGLAFQIAGMRDQLARVRVAVLQRYGRRALEAIDLPELSGGTLDADLLRVAAVLLWARYVDEAGLPRFVEALAEGVYSGRLLFAIGNAGLRLGRYWQRRSERFSHDERRELYGRLFGGGGSTDPNTAFFPSFAHLIAELTAIARAPDDRSSLHLQVRANAAAREVGASLTQRSAGLAAYAAQQFVEHVDEALRILRDPEIVAALGGQSTWALIQSHAPAVLGVVVEPSASLARAQAGHGILLWLADNAAAIDAGTAVVTRAAPVVALAERWRATEGGA